MKLSNIYSLLFLIFLSNCGQDRPVAPSGPEPFKASSSNLELKEVSQIPLRGSKLDILGIQDFKWIDSDRFAFVDVYFSRQAYIFNKEGTIWCELGRRGEGPGEYQSPTGIAYFDKQVFVSSVKGRLNQYNDCEFVEMHPLPANTTIAKGLLVTKEGRILLAVFSRYSKHSIFVLDLNGKLEKKISEIDKDFPHAFDTFHPQGGILYSNNKIFQFFNHRYEILAFNSDLQEEKRINLHSSLYVAPNYNKAKKIKGAKKEKEFRATFTQFVALKQFKDGYITILRSWPEETMFSDVIEFWDQNFLGYGRFPVPPGEEIIGSHEDRIYFFNADTSTIIVRSI